MFWILLTAHLVADYPLQTDRMVIAKRHLPGLTVHVGVHLLVMALFTASVLRTTLPYILAIAAAHFAIDAFKNYLSHERPGWVIVPYFQDQVLHLASLLLIALWMARTTALVVWEPPSPWWLVAIGLVLSTHVWFVTERVLIYRDRANQNLVSASMWMRIGVRAVLYALFLTAYVTNWLLGLVAGLLAALVMFWLYRAQRFPSLWPLVDLGVALGCAAVVIILLNVFGF